MKIKLLGVSAIAVGALVVGGVAPIAYSAVEGDRSLSASAYAQSDKSEHGGFGHYGKEKMRDGDSQGHRVGGEYKPWDANEIPPGMLLHFLEQIDPDSATPLKEEFKALSERIEEEWMETKTENPDWETQLKSIHEERMAKMKECLADFRDEDGMKREGSMGEGLHPMRPGNGHGGFGGMRLPMGFPDEVRSCLEENTEGD